MKINSKNKVNGNNNNTNNKKKLIVLMTIVIITIITIKKNIIFSIRNNELTHYMSIFVISLIRDHTQNKGGGDGREKFGTAKESYLFSNKRHTTKERS